jgi:hypothetical protein
MFIVSIFSGLHYSLKNTLNFAMAADGIKKKARKLSQFFGPTSTYEKQTHWDGYKVLFKANAKTQKSSFRRVSGMLANPADQPGKSIHTKGV